MTAINYILSLRIYIISSFLLVVNPCFGQQGEISFKHLSTVDGLSNFTVLSIAQDQQGFMWFGTMDGLNRFDGKQVRTYRYDADMTYSLGNNLIHSLLCTSDSGLWVGTSQGLYYYQYYHDDFHLVPILDHKGDTIRELEIKAMINDGNLIWIGTSHGLFSYDLVNATVVPYLDNVQGNIIYETVEALHRSDDGSVWIGGEQGLFKFHKGKLNRIKNDVNQKYSDDSNVISINSDKDGNIWFGTLDLETGLLIYNPQNDEFIDLNARDGYLPHNKVNCLYRFNDGNIWAGTTWGLSIINQTDHTAQILLYERQNPESISHNSIRDIFEGKDGIIWVGTYSGGINYFDSRSQLISHTTNIYQNNYSLSFNIVSSIFEDRSGDLWIGTEYGGLNILNKEDHTFSVLRRNSDANSLKSNNVKGIIEDVKGRKFIATQFGLSIYDPTTKTFFNVDDQVGPRGKLNFYGVIDFCEDNENNIWIGTHHWIGTSKLPGKGYLLKYDIKKDSIFHYIPDNAQISITDGGINSLVYDTKNNIIWCGGDNGLSAFDNNTKQYIADEEFMKIVNFLQGVVINDLYLGPKGMLWIATFGNGMILLDVNSYQFKRILNNEGFREHSIYAIVGDDDGNVWASSSAYLLKINAPQNIADPVTKVERYGIQEGFPPQQFFRAAACKGSDGRLYFGGDDGYIAFNPADIENIVIHPKVTVIDISVNGKSLEVELDEENQFLNVAALRKIILTYAQSSFAVQFIAPNFINPENTWYQYQLSGIHNSWQELGLSNTINFPELKAGNYTLKLRASSDPENFVDEYTSMQIEILPPFWASSWAYLIYLVIILILLYLFFIIARKWERLNQNLKFEHLQREQEKEFNQKRIKFFTDISHELRTPLTLILAPLERIVKSNFGNAKIKNQLMLMLRNGDRMLQLINQLLDLRKLETGHMRLQAAKGNIVRFVKEISLSFRELANDRHIDFNVNSSKDNIALWFDRDKLEIILFNLLSNAIKYTPEHGFIAINIDEVDVKEDNTDESGCVHIQIENTGKGIEAEHLDYIFERFYSGEKSNKQEKYSSGVGLEIVKNLVELHKGSISVESQFSEDGIHGHTTFILSLKRGKQHLSTDEIQKVYKNSEDIANYELPKPDFELDGTEQLSSTIAPIVNERKDESILIVEDNADVRELVVKIFNDVYNTFEAGDGAEGLKIAQEKMPDLIISDIMMPVMDGIELCRNIKTDVNTSHIPVILLTARTAVTFKYEGLETGADDYIIKPFNVEDLRLRATNLIKQRKFLKERFGKSGLLIPTELSITSVDERLLQKAIDYVMGNIDDSNLTVDRIAREIGMSRTNFYRKIKALTNLSAAEFLRTIKMNHAAELLKTNKVRISEVAAMVGFSDNDYFRESFKKQFGLTPTDFMASQEKSPGLA